jgi:hypothetical protein
VRRDEGMTISRAKKRIVVVVAAGSLLVTPGMEAQAHRYRQGSTVTIRYDKPNFKGRVKSDREFCKKKRRIVIHRVRPGKDPVVARTVTNDNGRYSVKPGPKVKQGKSYYAVAKRKKKKKHRHSHICKRARSNTITI